MKRASLPLQRRAFIAGLGSAATWPLMARAEQQGVPVIGWLNRESADLGNRQLRAFREGLKEAGYLEGQNIAIEYRWANGRTDILGEMAADLVRRNVKVILAGADSAALAAKAATTTTPIVFMGGNDPVKLGLVESLNRPNSNLTGVTSLNIELGPKRLEILRQMVPDASEVIALVNPANPSAETITNELRDLAQRWGLPFHLKTASNESQIDDAFARLPKTQTSILVIGADVYYITQSAKLGELTAHNRIPAIFQTREFVQAGGLIGYGTSIADQYRAGAAYVARILRGENPRDLPVQQATKIELFVNLKTAKALNVRPPVSLLARADEVIE